MSGGEIQRVSIARAMSNNPDIILADEPTGNLDTKTGKDITDILRKLNKEFGVTLILITHEKFIAKVAERIIYLKDGKIIKEDKK
jgi:putative ABC transport system ATP-binding protein